MTGLRYDVVIVGGAAVGSAVVWYLKAELGCSGPVLALLHIFEPTRPDKVTNAVDC